MLELIQILLQMCANALKNSANERQPGWVDESSVFHDLPIPHPHIRAVPWKKIMKIAFEEIYTNRKSFYRNFLAKTIKFIVEICTPLFNNVQYMGRISWRKKRVLRIYINLKLLQRCLIVRFFIGGAYGL